LSSTLSFADATLIIDAAKDREKAPAATKVVDLFFGCCHKLLLLLLLLFLLLLLSFLSRPLFPLSSDLESSAPY
jgi:hypothetical protein